MKTHARAGFTLLEMLVAVSVMVIIFGVAIPFYLSQIQAMDRHAGRFDAQQNARFGAATIDRELRVAGAGLPDKQPMIVQADPYAITFNADLATNTLTGLGSFGAVYFDPDLSSSAVTSLLKTSQVTLPLSTRLYPDSNYTNQSGPLSYAETISFWVAPDTNPGSSGTHALYRRVNDLPPTVVARGLVLRSGDPPPFTYTTVNDLGVVQTIPTSRLPAFHTAIHGGPADTSSSALTDSIRTVRIHLVSRHISTDGRDTAFRVVDMGVRLMNSGLLRHSTCGEAPVFSQTVTATYAAGPPVRVVLTWNRAIDEGGGEKDVERYSIFRRLNSATDFGEPYGSIPAGQTAYEFVDEVIEAGQTYVYAVAAQDCGGQFSPMSSTTSITIPSSP